MKVLGINGSPRIGGNSDILLTNALYGAKNAGAETEKIYLTNLKFSACLECDELSHDGICRIKDDMQEIYQSILNVDAVIIASPIFFGSISAQTKMMIDRFQCMWLAKNVFGKKIFYKKRKGAFISVEASSRRDFFDNSRAIIKNFFATVDVKYMSELMITGIETKAGINEYPNLIEKAYDLGLRIAGK